MTNQTLYLLVCLTSQRNAVPFQNLHSYANTHTHIQSAIRYILVHLVHFQYLEDQTRCEKHCNTTRDVFQLYKPCCRNPVRKQRETRAAEFTPNHSKLKPLCWCTYTDENVSSGRPGRPALDVSKLPCYGGCLRFLEVNVYSCHVLYMYTLTYFIV